MDGDTTVDRLGCEELERKLELAKSTLNDKKESLQSLRDNASKPSSQRRKSVVPLSSLVDCEKVALPCFVQFAWLVRSPGMFSRLQAGGSPPLGEDEAELPGVQGGDLHSASQPTGGSPPERAAGELRRGITAHQSGITNGNIIESRFGEGRGGNQ